MNILAPANFAFAALIGAILLLYMLRLKRRERIISSTFLWPSALRDLQANSPWQKLRSSPLMWLQIAFLALCVLALVRPALRVLAGGGQNMAIILDASASMSATDIAPTRFARAQNEARRLVDALSPGDSAAIILCGAQTRVLIAPTNNKNALKSAINAASAQDTSNNLNDAIALASSLLQKKNGAQIYLLSDGAAPALSEISSATRGLQFVKIGARNDNIAITALDARRGYASGSQYQIFATVRNYSPRAQSINLKLARDGNVVAVRPLTIAAGAQQSQLFDDLNIGAGTWSVRFDADDDLKADNIAYTQIAAQRAVRVLMVSDGDLFLERALNIDPNVQLLTSNLAGYAAARAKNDFDIVVCDGQIPPDETPANQLIFGAVDADSPVVNRGAKTEFAANPSVVDWDKKDAVTQFAPWSDVRFAQSLAVKTKPWARALVESENTPLVVVGQRGARRVVWCGFSLSQTDLPLRVAFPIFITNAVRWLSNQNGGETTTLRSGQSVPLDVPKNAANVTVSLPDGTTRQIAVNASANGARNASANSATNGAANDENSDTTPLFSGADRVGEYSISSDGGNAKTGFAVSLLSAQESDLMPRDTLRSDDGKSVVAENRPRANRELWSFFVAAALLILGLEWWIYHRGA